jgi:hypothetical protein
MAEKKVAGGRWTGMGWRRVECALQTDNERR